MSKSPQQVGTSTTTTNNTVPPWVSAAQQGLMAATLGMTAPFLQPPTSAVAGFTPPQELAFDLANYNAQKAYTTPPLNVTDFGSYTASPANVNAPASAAQASAASIDPSKVSLAQAAQMGPAALASIVRSDPAVLGKAEQLGYADISKFFNPYQKDVINTTVSQLEDANARALTEIRARQAAEGAYGGNRGALQESEQYRNLGNTLAQTIAALNQSGWNNAAGLGAGNAQLRQQTGLANQQAQNAVNALNAQLAQQTGLTNAGAQNQAAALNAQLQQQANMSNQAAKNLAQTLNAQMQQQANMGNAQFQQQANLANQQMAMQNGAWQQQANMFNANQPFQAANLQNQLNQTSWQNQLQALQGLLGVGGQQQQMAQSALNVPWNMLNILRSTVPTSTGSSSSVAQPIMGPSDFQSILPLLALGGSLLSDRSAKKDIRKVGRDPRTDLDMYKYRYRGEPKDAPKRVGPMAQQVERKYPGATHRVAGKMAIKPAARAMLGV